MNAENMQNKVKQPPSSPAFDRVMLDNLSVRARNTLMQIGVRDEYKLVELDKADLLEVRHCGKKTARELLKFRRAIINGKYALSPDSARIVEEGDWIDPEEEPLVLNALVNGLGSRGRTTLDRLNVNSVKDFLYLPLIDVPNERGTGAVTVSQICSMKGIFIEFLERAKSIPKSDRLNSLCEYIFIKFARGDGEWHLDPDTPLRSIRTWIADTARGIDKVEQAVLMRMGLYGQEEAMTLEKAGSKMNLTRERVRQLNSEFRFFAKWIVAQRRLDPLIAKIADLLEANGGSMLKTDLLRALASEEGTEEDLARASRFLDFISESEPWTRRGLECGTQGVSLG